MKLACTPWSLGDLLHHQAHGHHGVGHGERVGVAQVDLVLAGGVLVLGVLDRDAHLLEGEHASACAGRSPGRWRSARSRSRCRAAPGRGDGVGVGEVEVLDLGRGEEGEARSRARSRVRRSTWRGQPSKGVPSRLKMSQNTRATGASSGCQGRIWKVFGSGRASTSLSWTRLKPSMADPSKVMPSSRAFSSSAGRDGEGLGGAEHVGEPQLDEAHAPLLDRPQHVLLLAPHVASADPPPGSAWRPGPAGPTSVAGTEGPVDEFMRRLQTGNARETGSWKAAPAADRRIGSPASAWTCDRAYQPPRWCRRGARQRSRDGPPTGRSRVTGRRCRARRSGRVNDQDQQTKEDQCSSGPRRKYSAWCKDEGIEIVDVRFVDLPGLMQHFSVPAHELTEDVFEEGFGFDGSSIRGFQEIQESDMLLMPDPNTAVIDPFRQHTTLNVNCFVRDPVTARAVLARPALHRPARPRRTWHDRARRHLLLRARGRVLHLQRRALLPGPASRLLPGRLGRGALEHRRRRGPEPRLQDPPQGGLLPGSARRTTSRTCARR